MSFAEFVHMGGYGFYVWSSWVLAAFVLVANYLIPLRREKQILRRLNQRERRRPQ